MERLRKLRKDMARFKRTYEYMQARVYTPRRKRIFGVVTIGDVARNYQDLLRLLRRDKRWKKRVKLKG